MATKYEVIQAEIQNNCGNRNDDSFLQSIMFKTNMVIRWLATQREWPELQKHVEVALTSGKDIYTLAELSLADKRKIYQMRLYDGTRYYPPLHYAVVKVYTELFVSGATTTSGKPTHCTEFGGQFRLNPEPDSAYTLVIDYIANPGTITGPNSLMPYEDLDGAIACLVTGYAWLGLGDSSIANSWFKTGSDLAKSFGIDTDSLLNFTPQSRTEVSSTGTPWADPFTRRT